jgi:ABC-type multidrug transport system ATPase subunit
MPSSTTSSSSDRQRNALEWWDLRVTVTTKSSNASSSSSSSVTVEQEKRTDASSSTSTKTKSAKKKSNDDFETTTTKKTILDQTSGSARCGRLLCVLGPSGSGKTTFLNALSGRLLRNESENRGGGQKTTYAGDVLLNGALVSKSNSKYHNISYVEQDPKFFSNLTVRETLTLDCRLRDANASAKECERIVENVMSRYGLLSCADTLVGGDSGGKEVRGISGGEKRRLSIACETAFSFGSHSSDGEKSYADGERRGQHQLVVCDEPTSGLDAFSADRVVSQLAGLAVERRAVVVCSLHQPRSASWSRAHDVMLLANGGRVAYHGPVSKCIPYFTSIGYECPANYNPAEFLIDLVSIVTDCGAEARENSIERVDDICRTWRRQKPFVDRQAIQVEYEESKALERNMFDPNRNQKQRTLMTYQDFHNMMHDHTLTRAETTITQENGAPLSFRDFEKTFAKPLETYGSKQHATTGNGVGMTEEKSRFSEEKDDDERDDDGYKTASTTPIKRNEQSDFDDNDDENLSEFEKTRKKILSRSGSVEDVRPEPIVIVRIKAVLPVR